MYRFWLRLYRKPIPRIAVIVKWIDLLAQGGWYRSQEVKKVVGDWLNTYYYETGENLFKRILQLMLHLGLVRIGEMSSGEQVLRDECYRTPMGLGCIRICRSGAGGKVFRSSNLGHKLSISRKCRSVCGIKTKATHIVFRYSHNQHVYVFNPS